MRSPFVDIVMPENEVTHIREDEVMRFSPFSEDWAMAPGIDGSVDEELYHGEVAVDDPGLKSLPVPEKNPVPFAPLPATGSYWPIITSHSRGREVAFIATDKTVFDKHSRRFLAHRSDGGRYHVGIDLWANDKDPVVACEDGTIVAFYHFYRSTYALLVEHNNLVINYGEVHKDSLNANGLKIGDRVKAGQKIGMVGKMYSSSMLHFETYTKGTRSNKRFMVGGTPPKEILNPTSYLLFLNKYGLRGTGSGTTSVPVSIPSGTTGWSRAVQLNRKYSAELGWDQHVYEINDLLLKVTGQSGISLGEEAFAEAVAIFQRQQGLTGKNADGIIGPDTWRRMKPLLSSVTTTVTPDTKPTAQYTNTDPEIISNLGRYASLIEAISKTNTINPNVVRGIIAAESGGNSDSGKGRSGYKGLMQAYPDDVSYSKKSDYHGNQLDPETSIKSGVAKFILFRDKILKPWLTRLGITIPPDEDINFLKASLSCYNAGPVTAMKAIQYAHKTGDWRQWLHASHYQRALVFSGGYARYETCSRGKNSYEIEAAKKESGNYRFKKTPDWRIQPDPAAWNELSVAIHPIMRCWIETKFRNTPGYLDKFIKYYQYYESNPVSDEVAENETEDFYESSELYETEMTDEYLMDEAEMVDEQEMMDEGEMWEVAAETIDAPVDAGDAGMTNENVIIDGSDELHLHDLEVYDTETELQYGSPEAEQFIDEESYEQHTAEVNFSNEFDVAPAQGVTDYLNTSAVDKRTLKTGVFIPAGYKKEDKVDLIIYFHGLYQHGNRINGIEYYWKNYSNIRASFIESHRNAILLAPTLTSDPQQSSIVFGKDSGFDNFVTSCIKELKSRNYITASAEPHRIIIAGHSAGGSVLRRILGGKNQLLSKVIECWGFDCLYNYNWEKLKISIPFYHYWAFNGSGCISSPGIRGEKLQKSHGIQNIGPRHRSYHQGIIAYAWRNEINMRAWFS